MKLDLGHTLTAALALALMTGAYVALRLVGIDRFVTSDEAIWLGRSANFYRALASGELHYTFQFAHPGVLTMWSGLVGYLVSAPGYPDQFHDNLRYPFDIHLRLRAMGLDELRVLVSGRISKIMLQAALFVISMIFVRRLFGGAVTLVAGVLIAGDPFLSGIDSLLHVDGLFAIATFAAVLALAHAVQRGDTAAMHWGVAGALAALAWLTRSTGVVLVPILAGALLVRAIVRHRGGMPARKALGGMVLAGGVWGGSALLVTIALWPALWVDPVGVLTAMWSWSASAADGGHELPTFFAGTIHPGDPGPWFYPATLLWRLTPVSILGVVLLAVAVGRRRLPAEIRVPILMLTVFAVLFVVGMNAGAKKFDRYILPVYPIVDLLAAVGIVVAAGACRRFLGGVQARRAWLPAVNAVVGALLAIQLLSTVSVFPYRLDYYNPLLGGPRAAESSMQMGWGEGMELAAEIIMADSEAVGNKAAHIRISGSREPLLYLLPSTYTVYPSSQAPNTLERWETTDYYVAYIQRWQRELDHRTISYLEQFEPIGTAEVQGVQFVRVYRLADIPPPIDPRRAA